MNFKLSIDMGNAAFDDCSGDEVARILREVAEALDSRHVIPRGETPVRDYNGNRVGSWRVK